MIEATETNQGHIATTAVQPATLRFLGATDTVTGSRYLLEGPQGQQLLVDCGLFQGVKKNRRRNWLPFPVAPASIDAVVLTHAHLDHCGYLPRLVREGFRGRIFASPATMELARIVLMDSAHLQEEEARHAQKHGYSIHEHPEPLYTTSDAVDTIRQLEPVEFGREVSATTDIRVTLLHAGHILGAAQVLVETGGSSVLFTGDLGRADDPLLKPPAPRTETDYVVTESTYGDRHHPVGDPLILIGEAIARTVNRGGVVLIPAFAVGRTEHVLLVLDELRQRGQLPAVPIYVNSPMATDVLSVYGRHPDEHRLPEEQLHRMYSHVRPVHSVEESKALNNESGPMIIISASGMLSGGRILHHLARFGVDERNTIILTGFQAQGTRGAALAAGERTVRLFGKDLHVRSEVVQVTTMSAHADGDEILRWLRSCPSAPSAVFVTHGEPSSADVLRARIAHELHWQARVPDLGEYVDLEPRSS